MKPFTALLCLPLLLISMTSFAGPAEDANTLIDR